MAVYKDTGRVNSNTAELSRVRVAEREAAHTAALLYLLMYYPLDDAQFIEIASAEGITAIELMTLLTNIEQKKLAERGENGRYSLTKAGTAFVAAAFPADRKAVKSAKLTALSGRLLEAAKDVYADSQFSKAVRVRIRRVSGGSGGISATTDNADNADNTDNAGYEVAVEFQNEADGSKLLDIVFHTKAFETAKSAKANIKKAIAADAVEILRGTLKHFM